MWTVGELLAWTQQKFAAQGIESPRTDAEHLLAHALGCTRMDLYVRHADVVGPEHKASFRDAVRRRLGREPVAYIEGKKGFHALDLELAVDRRVLVPRPETEHLVDWLLESLRLPPCPPLAVVDVGTGSGAIALALKRARPDVRVVATDVSPDALDVARANAERLGLEVELVLSDLLDAVEPPAGGWDAIAANLPYIPAYELETLQPEVRDHEPRLALYGGEDGLEVVRRLVEQAAGPRGLAPGGPLFLEVGHDQADRVCAWMRERGWEEPEVRKDYGGIPRIVRAFRPA